MLTAALAVTQSDSPDPAHVGDDITYTVQVHNDGPDDAEAVTLSDRLPDASTFSRRRRQRAPAPRPGAR